MNGGKNKKKKRKRKKKQITFFIGMILLIAISFLVIGTSKINLIDESKSKIYNSLEKKISIFDDKSILEAELILEENTYLCGEYCSATKLISLHKDSALIDDIIFYTKLDNGVFKEQPIRDYHFYILNGEKKEKYEIGEIKSAGNYLLKLEGRKKPSKTLDWQIISQNVLINEWAIWGNITDGDDAQTFLDSPEDNYISLSNSVQFNCSANVTSGASILNISLWHNGTGTWHLNQTLLDNSNFIQNDSTLYSTSSTSWINIKNYSMENKTINYIKHSCWGDNVGYCAINFVYGDGDNYSVNQTGGMHPDNFTYTNTNPFKPVETIELWLKSQSSGLETHSKDQDIYGGSNESEVSFNLNVSGITEWGCYACDSDYDCGFALENRTLIYDTTSPLLTINLPTGTYSHLNDIPVNITASDNYQVDYCYYNVTRGASLEVANTEIINCTNGTFSVSGNAEYVIHICINDTSNNLNCSEENLTISVGGVGGGGVGGGGGGGVEVEEIKAQISICKRYEETFLENWDNTKDFDVSNRVSALWVSFWDFMLCKSASSIFPI